MYYLFAARVHYRLPQFITFLFLLLVLQIGNSQCLESFMDVDNDGVCDTRDQCPNFDDDIDLDNDGIPYCQDTCIDVNENGICDEIDTTPIEKKLKIHFSLKRGFYDNAIEVQLIPNRPNTIIRYIIGTNPRSPTVNTGITYSSPIQIDNQQDIQTLKVIGTDGEDTTKVYTHSYIFNGFNLPTVVLSRSPYSTSRYKEIPISFEFIVPSNSPLKSIQEYAGTKTSTGGFHSGFSDKVYFRSEYGAGTLKEDLFSDFYYGPQKPVEKIDQLFLRSNHSDESMLKQIAAHDAVRATGQYAPAGRFVYLYKNGKLKDVRHLQERPEGGFMEAQTGYDKSIFEAYAGNIHADLHAKVRSGWEATRKAINIESFCNFLLNQWIANVPDFYHYRNFRAAGPADLDTTDGGDLAWHFFNWDMDLGYKGSPTYNPYTSPRHILRSVQEHIEFRLQFGDIINCTMENEGVFTASSYLDRIDERNAQLDIFLANHNELNTNTNRFLNQVSNFMPPRIQWMLSDFKEKNYYTTLNALTYSLEEGAIASGQQLSLFNPNERGNIYYTLDGSDVRTAAGTLRPEAILYQGPISLNNGVYDVFARVHDPSAESVINRWSATCGAKTFYVEQTYSNIIINEIHYNPKASINEQETVAGKNYEFIELKNIGNTSIDLNGSKFSKGVELLIDNPLIVPPNGFVVFAEDSTVFRTTYGFAPDGQYAGKLNNDGEKINLKDPFGNFIDSVRYNNKGLWDEGVDSTGFSLELLHPSLDNKEPLNWFRSDKVGGTPKAENSRICISEKAKIVINEINYHSNKEQLDAGDWVELHNPTREYVDLSGWTFYDKGDAFVIPQGNALGAGEYIVLVENKEDFVTAFPNVSKDKVIGNITFKLSNAGERITLFDHNKCLVDYVIYDDKLPWPKAADGDGPSLSLLDPTLDNTLPESWESSTEMNPSFSSGSPGRSNVCLSGTACNDGNDCTSNDIFDANCNCIGTSQITDSDNDGVCDAADRCDGIDDQLIGTPCDDGDECTTGEIFDANCNCVGGTKVGDTDNDGICDVLDTCNDNDIDAICNQQGELQERCGYELLYREGNLTIFNSDDAYITVVDLTTRRLIFYCDSWAEKKCADTLIIELESSKQYEVRILNLQSRCESRDTLGNSKSFTESSSSTGIRSKNLQETAIRQEPSIAQNIKPKAKVYPNPVQQVLNIDFEEYAHKVEKISLVNSLGQEVFSQVIDSSTLPQSIYQIDISSITKAFYFLQVIKDGEVAEIHKIIVK